MCSLVTLRRIIVLFQWITCWYMWEINTLQWCHHIVCSVWDPNMNPESRRRESTLSLRFICVAVLNWLTRKVLCLFYGTACFLEGIFVHVNPVSMASVEFNVLHYKEKFWMVLVCNVFTGYSVMWLLLGGRAVCSSTLGACSQVFFCVCCSLHGKQ